MSAVRRMEFGYNPPSGDRGLEVIQRESYPSDLHSSLDLASQAFTSLWVSDHLTYGVEHRIECWTLLSWIAARYPGVKLSTIVMCNSFRNPSLLAKMAGSLQEMSGGRFVLGYGAGWHQGEYEAFGYEYPTARTRIEMLEEGIQVIRALWTESPANFSGKHYRLREAFGEPRPSPVPPIMVGGGGEKLTLGVVARQADWWNDVYRPPDVLRHKLEVLRQHCHEAGRDFGQIRKTFTARIFIDRSHAAALDLAGERLQSGEPPIAGDPSAVRDRLTELGELGFDLCIAAFPRFQDLQDMRLFMDEVMPDFA